MFEYNNIKKYFVLISIFILPIILFAQWNRDELLTKAETVAADTTELKQKTASDGRYVYLKQLSASNPNGGGWFVLADSSYPEGIIAFDTPTVGKQWVRVDYLKNKYINIQWAGADNDSTTNDAPALFKALEQGNNIYIPGIDQYYLIQDTIINITKSNVHIWGDGYRSKLKSKYININPATSDGHLMAIYGSIGNPVKNVIIEKLHFDTNSEVNQNGFGFVYTENSILRDSYFSNIGRKAITMQNGNYKNKVSNIHIFSASREPNATRYAITLDGISSTNRNTKGNILENITIDFVSDSVGGVLSVGNADSNIIRNIVIRDSASSPKRGILLQYASNNIIDGFQFNHGWSKILIDVQSQSSNNTFKNIYGNYGVGSPAIWVRSGAINNKFENINGIASGTFIIIDSGADYTVFKNSHISITFGGGGTAIYSAAKNVLISKINIDSTYNGVSVYGEYNYIENVTIDSSANIGFYDNGTGNVFLNNYIRASASGKQNFWFNGTDAIAIGNVAIGNNITVSTSKSQRFMDGNSWNGRTWWASTRPTTGTYSIGDKVYATNPQAVGALGWVCVASGTPGTWRMFGILPLTGQTSNRNSFQTNYLTSDDFGYIYRDETLSKWLIWNGATWDTLAIY